MKRSFSTHTSNCHKRLGGFQECACEDCTSLNWSLVENRDTLRIRRSFTTRTSNCREKLGGFQECACENFTLLNWLWYLVENSDTFRIGSSVIFTTRASDYREKTPWFLIQFHISLGGWGGWEISPVGEEQVGSTRGAAQCQWMRSRVPYFSLYKLKIIQSPDRGLTRTSELESSAYAALRHMILFLRSSLSHNQRSGKCKGDYRLFSYRVGQIWVQKMEPTWGVRSIKEFKIIEWVYLCQRGQTKGNRTGGGCHTNNHERLYI